MYNYDFTLFKDKFVGEEGVSCLLYLVLASSKVLEEFWASHRDTEWFKRHPILSSPETWLSLGLGLSSLRSVTYPGQYRLSSMVTMQRVTGGVGSRLPRYLRSSPQRRFRGTAALFSGAWTTAELLMKPSTL